ncbi:MAG TPA: hypothetical protein VFR03_03955 [Thermoanaerobaculia bacterium]|nr:hypothetical protein [Thermoanaerobaculia bacterium]
MFSQTLRKAAAILSVATAIALSCAAPSRASLLHPHSFERPGVSEPGGFVASLLHLIELIGGALDPNGNT